MTRWTDRPIVEAGTMLSLETSEGEAGSENPSHGR